MRRLPCGMRTDLPVALSRTFWLTCARIGSGQIRVDATDQNGRENAARHHRVRRSSGVNTYRRVGLNHRKYTSHPAVCLRSRSPGFRHYEMPAPSPAIRAPSCTSLLPIARTGSEASARWVERLLRDRHDRFSRHDGRCRMRLCAISGEVFDFSPVSRC